MANVCFFLFIYIKGINYYYVFFFFRVVSIWLGLFSFICFISVCRFFFQVEDATTLEDATDWFRRMIACGLDPGRICVFENTGF